MATGVGALHQLDQTGETKTHMAQSVSDDGRYQSLFPIEKAGGNAEDRIGENHIGDERKARPAVKRDGNGKVTGAKNERRTNDSGDHKHWTGSPYFLL